MIDHELAKVFGIVFALLIIATMIGRILKRRLGPDKKAFVDNLVSRVNAWWVMVCVLALAIVAGQAATTALFGFLSFLALREFITLTPSRPGDHRALFWVFFIVIPIQYYLVAIEWYGLFSVMIPVYAWLLIPVRCALAADCGSFLERTATIQWGLMVCVYFLSYVPAILMLNIPGYENDNAKLLVFLVFVTQFSDVMQYVWGKLIGKTALAPEVSPNKTLEGLIGGGLSAVALGTALWWMTPFTPWQAAQMSAVIVAMGFFGGLVMSAVKRDRGVKDYGALLAGHGGIMDRIDSLCFAAPVFFHLARFFFPKEW